MPKKLATMDPIPESPKEDVDSAQEKILSTMTKHVNFIKDILENRSGLNNEQISRSQKKLTQFAKHYDVEGIISDIKKSFAKEAQSPSPPAESINKPHK